MEVNGGPGAVFLDADHRLMGVLALDIAGGQISSVSWIVNPDTLTHLGPLADLRSLVSVLRLETRSDLVEARRLCARHGYGAVMALQSWAPRRAVVQEDAPQLTIGRRTPASSGAQDVQGRAVSEVRGGSSPLTMRS